MTKERIIELCNTLEAVRMLADLSNDHDEDLEELRESLLNNLNLFEKLEPKIVEEENKTFLETVMVNNGKKWECEFDNNCDETPEPLKELIIRANKFVKGTRIEIYAPLETDSNF